MMFKRRYWITMSLCALVLGCQSTPKAAPAGADPNDPATILPDLNKGHKDKITFAWYASTPLLRTVDPAVKEFAKKMEADHTRLQKELKAWGAKNNVDVTYHYAPGIPGEALKGMEKMQGDLIQSDNNSTFQRDYLILTWTDLDNQRTIIKVALEKAKDPELKAYLQDSLDTQTKEREECRGLLAKYKW